MVEQHHDQHGVTITPRDIYEAVQALRDTVQEMVGALKELSETSKDHEQRIRHVERGFWSLPAVSSIPGLASLLMSMGIFKP